MGLAELCKMRDDDPKRRALLHEAVRRGYDYVDVEYRSGFFDRNNFV